MKTIHQIISELSVFENLERLGFDSVIAGFGRGGFTCQAESFGDGKISERVLLHFSDGSRDGMSASIGLNTKEQNLGLYDFSPQDLHEYSSVLEKAGIGDPTLFLTKCGGWLGDGFSVPDQEFVIRHILETLPAILGNPQAYLKR
jgi:hypothetical protein